MVPELLSSPRRGPESTARISKTDVRKQNSEVLAGTPMRKKLEDSDGKRKVKRRAVNIKENLSKKICLKKQKEKNKCRRKTEFEESESE
jgi:hypothetical protein